MFSVFGPNMPSQSGGGLYGHQRSAPIRPTFIVSSGSCRSGSALNHEAGNGFSPIWLNPAGVMMEDELLEKSSMMGE